MLRQLSGWLQQISTGWSTLAAIAAFLLFTVLVLPGQAAEAEAKTGTTTSPDTSFYYTPADLYAMAEAYGPEGREAYIRARFTFDLIWPIVYGAFLATTLSWTARRAFPAAGLGRHANLLPLLGVLFDYLENTAASVVMARYPNPTPAIAAVTPWFTMAKWILIGASFGALIVSLAMAAVRWLRGRGAASTA